MSRIIIPVVIVLIIVASYLTVTRRQDAAAPASVDIALPPEGPNPQTQAPVRQFPVPDPQAQLEPARPLPDLDESDPVIEQQFNELVAGDTQAGELFVFKTFVRNFVVIVDNLTATKIPEKYQFVRPPAGTFVISKDAAEDSFINSENSARYLPFVRLVASMDTDQLVNLYVYMYPLFQQAYEELGYPDRYFNDRMVEVINHVLETPDVPEPIALVQPKVYFQFADPELEARSAGQKLLLRIGRENAAPLKLKLREILTRLTSLQGLPQ